VLCRSCLAASRRQARQLISHKHVTVNGSRVDRAGYRVEAGDEIAVSGDEALPLVRGNAGEVGKARSVPEWLEPDPEKGTLKVLRLPAREDIPEPIEEQLVVEFYGR